MAGHTEWDFNSAHLGSWEKLQVICSTGAWIIFLPSCCTPWFSNILLLYLSLLKFQKCFHGSCIYSHPDNFEGHVNTLLKDRQGLPFSGKSYFVKICLSKEDQGLYDIIIWDKSVLHVKGESADIIGCLLFSLMTTQASSMWEFDSQINLEYPLSLGILEGCRSTFSFARSTQTIFWDFCTCAAQGAHLEDEIKPKVTRACQTSSLTQRQAIPNSLIGSNFWPKLTVQPGWSARTLVTLRNNRLLVYE